MERPPVRLNRSQPRRLLDVDDGARLARLAVKHGEPSCVAPGQQSTRRIALGVAGFIHDQFAAEDHRIRIAGAAANPEGVEPRVSAALDFF